MAVTVKEDLVAGSGYGWDKSGGNTVRVFYVAGLPVSRTVAAQATAQPGMPGYFEEHPDIPGIFAQECHAEPYPAGSKTAARAVYTYRPLDNQSGQSDTIEIGDASSQRVLDRETADTIGNAQFPGAKVGSPLLVQYHGANLHNKYAYVRVPIPGNDSTLTWTRVERFAAGASPVTVRRAYKGKRNATTWMGFAAGTVMCTRVGAAFLGGTASGIRLYRMTYSFEEDSDMLQFQKVAYFKDLRTGNVPNDIVADITPDPATGLPKNTKGNGWRLITPSGTAEFNGLNLRAI